MNDDNKLVPFARLAKNDPQKSKAKTKTPARKEKKPKPVNAARLNNIALYYLERFSSSAENLRRVLMRRVDKSHIQLGTDREEGRQAVDEIVERFIEVGLLNDQLYARSVAFSQHRQGKSVKAIRMKLISKGVGSSDIDAALLELEEELEGDSDTEAAISYAKKRRLGPFRIKERAERRDRDMAALARQGFSYDLARKVIDAEDISDLDDLLY
ncbi:regulatory protein RecX [Curvivirga sp.]|uniref:regulatory protein RecX n=1 Tax=Curvivirga sp. TaxID=2856848 RepID=UPI003B59158E